MSHAKKFRDRPRISRDAKARVVSIPFPFLFSSFSRSPRRHAPQFFRAAQFFFISLSNTAFRLRDIDSRYLIPFGTTLRCSWKRLDIAIDRTSAVVGTAIVQKSRFSRSDAICVYTPSYARRTRFPFPDGKNTAAHDTSLDRYPVWRIRSFIGIDMFAVARSFTLEADQVGKTRFDPLGIIIRSYFERWDIFLAFNKFNKFPLQQNTLANSAFYNRKDDRCAGARVIFQTRACRTICLRQSIW